MLEQLRAEIDALAARDLSVGAAGLGPELLELFGWAERLHAQAARMLAAFEAAGGHADEQLTVGAWLRTQTTMSTAQAAAEAGVARLRRELPATFACWDAGEIGFAHLKAVRAGLRLLPASLWAEVDQPLATAARGMTPKELAGHLRELAQALQPAGQSREEIQREARRLSVAVGFDGMTVLSGAVTPEVGEKLSAALSAASRPDLPGELRLPAQRKADALEELLDRVLDTGVLPAEGTERPHLTVLVDLDQLAADGDDPAGARFSWTGPTSSATARRLACDSILLPIFTRGGEPVDVGRRTRTISPPLRAFLAARDRTCRWPGCTLPQRWTVVHHVKWWRDGGRTDRDNLILLCKPHHQAVHHGRYTLILDQPGVIRIRPRLHPDDPFYEIKPAPPPAGQDEIIGASADA